MEVLTFIAPLPVLPEYMAAALDGIVQVNQLYLRDMRKLGRPVPAASPDERRLAALEQLTATGSLQAPALNLGAAVLPAFEARDCSFKKLRLTVPSLTTTMYGGTFTLNDTDFDLLLSDEVLLLDGKVVDAQVTVGDGPAPQRLRLVGVPLPETGTYGFYLTNLPATIGPRQVADLYRIRWEIESHNKLDKACHRLDDIQARKPEAAEALVHATMIASIIACLIAHRQHLAERRPARATVPRPKPPIHPQRLARMVGVVTLELADFRYRRGTQYAREGWKRYAEMLIDEGRDPNWRRRPSILDQLRGWPSTPGAPPKARCANKSAHSSPSSKRANRS